MGEWDAAEDWERLLRLGGSRILQRVGKIPRAQGGATQSAGARESLPPKFRLAITNPRTA